MSCSMNKGKALGLLAIGSLATGAIWCGIEAKLGVVIGGYYFLPPREGAVSVGVCPEGNAGGKCATLTVSTYPEYLNDEIQVAEAEAAWSADYIDSQMNNWKLFSVGFGWKK